GQRAGFVLVHAAWGGAHGFRKGRGPLLAAGHEVFTPSLTGIGERAHLTSPQVNLTTHIADVVNAVWYEDLSDIVLLGYSYGGAVVTGALEHIGDRVRHLVYLDAFVPGDGDSVAGLGGAGAGHGVAARGARPAAARADLSGLHTIYTGPASGLRGHGVIWGQLRGGRDERSDPAVAIGEAGQPGASRPGPPVPAA